MFTGAVCLHSLHLRKLTHIKQCHLTVALLSYLSSYWILLWIMTLSFCVVSITEDTLITSLECSGWGSVLEWIAAGMHLRETCYIA